VPAAADGHLVFGDGTHATTRLCAGAVGALCRERPVDALLDIGTGTGLLARIARARGVRFVAGTDIDAGALGVARCNAALDADADPIHFGTESPDHWGARFELVVANILEGPLMQLAPAIAGAVRPSGRLLLSGFTRVQAPRLRAAYESQRFRWERDALLEGWVVQLYRRGAICV
jgi:ribosomal protein L11 methyltransferase